jgi:PleD family two-component response regulator
MQNRSNKKIVAAVEDLFFTVKINEAAKRAGFDVDFVKTEHDLLVKAKEKPTLIVIDLNINGFSAVNAITALKASAELKSISVLGYVSHVQGELKQQAHDAGANMVLARSAFSQNFPQILKRHSGV